MKTSGASSFSATLRKRNQVVKGILRTNRSDIPARSTMMSPNPPLPWSNRSEALNACSKAFTPRPPPRIHKTRSRLTPAVWADRGSNESVASTKAQNCSRVAPARSCACKLLRPAEQREGPTISVIPPQGIPPIVVSMTPTPIGIVRVSTGDRRANTDGTRLASRASISARMRAEEDIAVMEGKDVCSCFVRLLR